MSDDHPTEGQASEQGDEATAIFSFLLNEIASHPGQLLPPTAEEQTVRISSLERAMILHLMGLDHERLTGVEHAHAMKDILA